jgi:hypothetical protein
VLSLVEHSWGYKYIQTLISTLQDKRFGHHQHVK